MSQILPPFTDASMLQARPVQIQHHPNQAVVQAGPSAPEMDEILERLNNVTNNSFRGLRKYYNQDPRMQEAMLTQQHHYGDNEGGVEIDRYEIRHKLDESLGKNKKIYAIFDKETRQKIVDDLLVYESSLGITRLLNMGASMNDPRINKFLMLEQHFFSKRDEAGNFKRNHNKAIRLEQFDAADIINSKYQMARDQALNIKRQINRLCESIVPKFTDGFSGPISPRRMLTEGGGQQQTYQLYEASGQPMQPRGAQPLGTRHHMPQQGISPQYGYNRMQSSELDPTAFNPITGPSGKAYAPVPNDYASGVNLQQEEARANAYQSMIQNGDFRDYEW